MKKKFLLIATFLILVACTDPNATRKTLEEAGYSHIQTNGYSFFGCSKDDQFRTKFTAVNVNHQTVSGVVCCGILKYCTIRY